MVDPLGIVHYLCDGAGKPKLDRGKLRTPLSMEVGAKKLYQKFEIKLHFAYGPRQSSPVVKVTRHLCFKNTKNLRPQDILAFISANKPSFTSLNVKKLQIFAIFEG